MGPQCQTYSLPPPHLPPPPLPPRRSPCQRCLLPQPALLLPAVLLLPAALQQEVLLPPALLLLLPAQLPPPAHPLALVEGSPSHLLSSHQLWERRCSRKLPLPPPAFGPCAPLPAAQLLLAEPWALPPRVPAPPLPLTQRRQRLLPPLLQSRGQLPGWQPLQPGCPAQRAVSLQQEQGEGAIEAYCVAANARRGGASLHHTRTAIPRAPLLATAAGLPVSMPAVLLPSGPARASCF